MRNRMKTAVVWLGVAAAIGGASCGGDDAAFGPPGAGLEAGPGGGGGADGGVGEGGPAGDGQAGGATAGSAGASLDASLEGGQAGTGGGVLDASAEVSFTYDAPVFDSALNQDSACAALSAATQKLPLDVIFLIDNSGSMTQEIQAVENNINTNFASIIASSGIDYRVIMVARHGSASSAQSICVRAPLSGTNCSPIPTQPVNNPPVFFHYSREIASHDSLCKALTYFSTPDEFNLAPQGWSQWLRQGAIKAFVEITDDGVSCSAGGKTYNDTDTIQGGNAVAPEFDATLLALSPAQFGTAADRRYLWYSIVCMAANTPATSPWLPTDPMVAGKCNASNCPAPGTGYQALSILTGGLRFPLCQTGAYDAVFQAIAQGVIGKLACKFSIPTPEAGVLEPDKVSLKFTPSVGPDESWDRVDSPAQCAGDQWYYDNNANPSTIELCPNACTKAKADASGKIEILFGCAGG